MSNPSFEAYRVAGQQSADAFMQISRIWLDGAERLAALNLSVFRELVEDGANAAHSVSGVTSIENLHAMQPDIAPAIQKAMGYTRNIQAIVGNTQQQLLALMNAQLSTLSAESKAPAAWNAALDMFTRSARQMAEMSAGTVATRSANAPAKSARKVA